MRIEHVPELIANAQHRVERVHRALEDDRDLAPAQLAQLARGLIEDLDAILRETCCPGRRRSRR
jgi:hypothetical protein